MSKHPPKTLPVPPGTRLDSYSEHYPIAITTQVVDIGDPDRWRLFIDVWHYDHASGAWKRQASDDGLTMSEVRRLFEYVRTLAPRALS
jgi:hypothetical protein